MLGNYLAAALRNLLRNRAYSLINLCGLSLGFAAAILIALYVRDELSFDRSVPEHERIYLVGELIDPPGQATMRLSLSSTADAKALRLAFPEIETATRLGGSSLRLYGPRDNEGMVLASYWTDPNFFEVFPQRVVAGNLASALARPDGLVLTRRAARQLLGSDEVVGATLRVGPDTVMRVTAVIEDLPANSHLDCEVFLPGVATLSNLTRNTDEQSRPGAIRTENAYTYVRLRAGASIDAVRARLRGFADSHITGVLNGMRISQAYTFTLTPIADLHLQPRSVGEIKPAGDVRVLQALLGIALLILAVSCGNFVSMITARAARRAVEVGVRKAVGATRRQIILQFTGECLFYAVLALLLAVIAVDLILPVFNGFLRREMVFDYVSHPIVGLALMGLTLVTGLAAGAYPSFYLSHFKPNAVLRGAAFLPHHSRVRQGLVVFQFAVLIALLVTTLTVNRQIHFAIAERLRLPTDQIYLASAAHGCPVAFTDAVAALERVSAVSCTSDSALAFDHFSANFASPQGGIAVSTRAASVDYSFFDVFGIQPIAGRLLSPRYGQDDLLHQDHDARENPTLVINESAARALGYATPGEAVGKFVRWQRLRIIEGRVDPLDLASSEIVGVIADFSIGSARDAIEPTTYYVDPTTYSRVVFRFTGGSVQQALDSVSKLWAQQQSGRFNGQFLDRYVNDLYLDVVTQATIFSLFSGVAVVLAALGLLGLAIFTAERSTKEIGLRKVMGARRADILRFLGWRFARPVLWANLIAWPGAYLLMERWLQGFAYHTNLEPLTFVIAGALALLIALLTVASHAVWIARAKPVEALRYE